MYGDEEGDNQQYKDAFQEEKLSGRIKALLDWKGLSRRIEIDGQEDEIDELSENDWAEMDQEKAIECVRETLIELGILAEESGVSVTPAFVLHLSDSSAGDYSTRYPIFDMRVWDSYVYLTRERPDHCRLYADATEDAEKYACFCKWFNQTCPSTIATDVPDGLVGREYEKALFTFGKTIRDIPSTGNRPTLAHIDRFITKMRDARAYRQQNADK